MLVELSTAFSNHFSFILLIWKIHVLPHQTKTSPIINQRMPDLNSRKPADIRMYVRRWMSLQEAPQRSQQDHSETSSLLWCWCWPEETVALLLLPSTAGTCSLSRALAMRNSSNSELVTSSSRPYESKKKQRQKNTKLKVLCILKWHRHGFLLFYSQPCD